MKLKIEIEIELWVQCLHVVNKLDLDMVANSTFSLMYQYKKLLVCDADLFIQYKELC